MSAHRCPRCDWPCDSLKELHEHMDKRCAGRSVDIGPKLEALIERKIKDEETRGDPLVRAERVREIARQQWADWQAQAHQENDGWIREIAREEIGAHIARTEPIAHYFTVGGSTQPAAQAPHDDKEGKGPCGGKRCWKTPDGHWIHSSKSYGTCREIKHEPEVRFDLYVNPAAQASAEKFDTYEAEIASLRKERDELRAKLAEAEKALRGANFTPVSKTKAASWNKPSRPRIDKDERVDRIRWEWRPKRAARKEGK